MRRGPGITAGIRQPPASSKQPPAASRWIHQRDADGVGVDAALAVAHCEGEHGRAQRQNRVDDYATQRAAVRAGPDVTETIAIKVVRSAAVERHGATRRVAAVNRRLIRTRIGNRRGIADIAQALPVGVIIAADVQRQRRHVAAVAGVHRVDFQIAASVRAERDLGTVRRPDGLLILSSVGREANDVAAVDVHDVDIRIATVPIGREHEPRPIRGPVRLRIDRGVARQIDRVAPVGVHQIDLGVAVAVGAECDVVAIG